LRRRGLLAHDDPHERYSLLSGDLLKDCEEGVQVIEELEIEAEKSELRDIERLN
jgi:hypothetical protein